MSHRLDLPTSFIPARLSAWLLLAVALGGTGLPSIAGGPEREDAAPKPAKKVAVEEELPSPGTHKILPPDADPAAQISSPDAKLDEVALAAAEAREPLIKAFLAQHLVPFDRLTESGRQPTRIRPIPTHHTDRTRFKDAFGVADLDGHNRRGPERRVEPVDFRKLEHFEDIALADATQFLQAKDAAGGPGVGERQAAAEAVLAGALRFHDWAREHNARRGKAWDKVRPPLADKLREVRLARFKAAPPDAADDLAGRLVTLYPADAAVLQAVTAARLAQAEVLLKAGNPAELEKLRDVLADFEARHPGAGGDAVKRVREELSKRARKLLDEARREAANQNPVAAGNLIRTAHALDPDAPGLRDFQSQLKAGYPVLYVGVPRLPAFLSPARARFDSEKQAVELLFEGPLAEVPTAAGVATYRPSAAAGGGGRPLVLARGAAWGSADRPPLSAHDVDGTLRLLRARPGTWPALAAEAWDERVALDNSGGVRLSLRRGHPDPRALLTFKLLPARYLADRGKAADDLDFARQPVGSGPFRFAGTSGGLNGRPGEAVFVDNPAYARPGKSGQPALREIRMVELPKVADPVAEMKAGRLHLLPDVPTADLDKVLSPAAGLDAKFQAYTAAHHRRVHVLAINHRQPALQSKDLRRGLSLAFDRDAVLTEVFRSGKAGFHKPMSGPFPPESWATAKDAGGRPVPPVPNRDLATALLNQYLAAGGQGDLTVFYPDDEPLAAAACAALARQVADLFKDVPAGGRRLALKPQGLSPRELLERVEDEHRFELAYVPFDYPDDWFHLGLGAYLDPAAGGRGGRNVTGYLAPGTAPDPADLRFARRLAEAAAHSDVAGELVPRAHELHRLFNDAVPFVPLWQLYRHLIAANALKVVLPDSPEPVSPRVLNPALLFQGVGRWRLE